MSAKRELRPWVRRSAAAFAIICFILALGSVGAADNVINGWELYGARAFILILLSAFFSWIATSGKRDE